MFMEGGGCGVGLGLGWGFGSAYGTRYLDSKLKFQAIDFEKVKTVAASQESVHTTQNDSWTLSCSEIYPKIVASVSNQSWPAKP